LNWILEYGIIKFPKAKARKERSPGQNREETAMAAKIFFLCVTVLTGLFIFTPPGVLCQERGFKYITHYTPREYGRKPQNWCVAQDRRGIITVANQDGLLEFDGVSWRSIAIPHGQVRSLAVDSSGTVYIGGSNEIGFLSPDTRGALQYNSLCDRLKESQKNFSIVWNTAYAAGAGVCFRTSRYLFRWHNGQITAYDPEPAETFNALFACGGKLYVRQEGIGLRQVAADRLELAPGGEMFADKKIFMMVPYDSGRVLIGTRNQGFYLYDGAGTERFYTEADDYVKESLLYHGRRLLSSPGDFALATLRGGLVIIDSAGRLKYIFDEDSGLPDNDVKYVFEDNQGNLWLALNDGLAKIEYTSPVSIFDKRSNLRGLILSVIRHGSADTLYVGTTRGLYALDPAGSPGRPGKFRPLPGIANQCWSLLSIGGTLLAATNSGIFQIESQNNLRKVDIERRHIFILQPSKADKNRIWAGTQEGLFLLYRKKGQEGQWEKEVEFKAIKEEIRTIVEDEEGDLWLGIRPEGVLRVASPAIGTMIGPDPAVTAYNRAQGLPPGRIDVFTAAGHVMFASEQGIYRFDEKSGRFSSDFTLGTEFAGGENGRGVYRLVEDRDKTIWINSRNKNIQAEFQPDGTFFLDKTPFLRIPPAEVDAIYPDPGGKTIWFGSDDGLLRYEKGTGKNYDLDFQTLIRKIWINGQPVFDDYSKAMRSFSPIAYRDGNLRFEFAAPFFEGESGTRYRCLLEGHDDNWSSWSSEPQKEYTNLDFRSFTFRVQARNAHGKIGQEATYHFEVLPPWYLTWWAMSAYILTALLLIILIVRWRSWKLQLEKQALERIVKKRTKEIDQKNRQLELQTKQLKEQSEKLQEMDRVKSRFFANISHEFRTPLTLIMGPLEQMLHRSRDKDQQEKLNLMLRNSQRLLARINQLLELSRFESGTLTLQASDQNIILFLKGIVASFEPAAAKNGLDLTFRAEEETINLYFDPGKLEEIMFNLLANALKFTPPGDSITVSAKRVTNLPGSPEDEENFPAHSLEISVQDTGPGIPRDQLAHIFDRFYQSDSTSEHHRQGSGIGLSIAKELVELHHGEIDVHSHEGKGTEFNIRLPMGKGHLKPEEIVEAVETPAPRKTFDIPANLKPTVAAEETDADRADQDFEPPETEKEIILVVEDSADVRGYIKDALEPLYAVVEAEDGREGMHKARQIVPDLIISDIMMPEVDGYELCNQLKGDISTSHIPIILLTARASEENIIRGLETGADDYIVKPFNTRILAARIKNLIELRRQMQQTLSREMSLQPTKISISRMDKEFIKKLYETIEENIGDEEFNVHLLCRKMKMSQPTLYRKISALSGESPTEFIRSYRLKRGAELLKSSTGTVVEVAFQVGFSSANYFSKCFKNKFHQSPTTYQASDFSP
jgi:signal transduction histidine kinase/DNA-binding response OmpR family regulator